MSFSKNYLVYYFISGASIYGLQYIYRNRWNILNQSVDLFLETRRWIKECCDKSNTYQGIIVKQIRFRTLINNKELSQSCYLVDIHTDGKINLDHLPLQSKYDHHQHYLEYNNDLIKDIEDNGIKLVDIDYQFNGQHYRYTTKYDNQTMIDFYQLKDIKSKFQIFFDDVEIYQNQKQLELTHDQRDKIVKRFNQYLGPLHDFHSSLSPINSSWLSIYDLSLSQGDKIVLTTQLFDTVNIIWGDQLAIETL